MVSKKKKMTEDDFRISRYERLEIILDILNTGDHLETSTVAEKLSIRLEKEINEAFRRSVHRDLNELVERGKIYRAYYDRNGNLLADLFEEDEDEGESSSRPGINAKCKWYIAEKGGEIVGYNILQKKHIDLWLPELLDGVSAFSGDAEPRPDHKAIYFVVANQYLRIEIHKDLLPFSLLISRHTDEDFRQAEKDFISKKSASKHFGILKIPYPELSAYKNQDKPGHSLITFRNQSIIEIYDFESSNGTFAFPSPLTPEHVKEIRGSHNMSTTLKKLDMQPLEPTKIQKHHVATLPALLELGVDFMLVV